MPPSRKAGSSASRARGALLAVPVLAGAVYCGAVVVDHASKAVYAVPGWGVAVTVVLLCLSLVGCGLVAWSRQPGFSAVVLSGVALGVLGLLAITSIGMFALLLACALLGWAGLGGWSGAGRGQAAVGAVLAGAPLPLLVIFAIAGPLVTCDRDGVTSGENVFLGLESSGGSGSVSSDGAAGDATGAFQGRSEGSGYDYSYVCRDGRLVHFDLRRH
jgi:hypothetical protein